MAITTAASLVVAQESDNILKTQSTTMSNDPLSQEIGSSDRPRRQDTTLGGVDAQTRPETASKMSRDPPLLEVNTSRRREDSMEYHDDLTVLSTSPYDFTLYSGCTVRHYSSTTTTLFGDEIHYCLDTCEAEKVRMQGKVKSVMVEDEPEEEKVENEKLEEDNDAEKEELRDSMDVVPRDDVAIDSAFWSLNKDILKITILKTNTPYPSRKIRCICACAYQRPQRNDAQYVNDMAYLRPLDTAIALLCIMSYFLGIEYRLHPYHFNYPKRSPTMEEMLNKFIEEGKREHEEMRAFIYDFQTTNELLFKERNNLLIELRFRVQELLKVINNIPMIDCDVKRVTTRGEKTTTQDVHDNNTNVLPKEPLVVELKKPVRSNDVLTNDQP
ncbi:hypothetical protein Tco_1054744 [Tanacetum coccineum]|uniref:Uncharacterized protein n=1 Tax=Tanacetum coccineum TaxID=301880 RepID=A0ABQ5GXN5_9ASTR